MRLVLPGTGEPLASLVLAAGLFLLSMAWREFGLALGLYLACRALRAAVLAQRERKAPLEGNPWEVLTLGLVRASTLGFELHGRLGRALSGASAFGALVFALGTVLWGRFPSPWAGLLVAAGFLLFLPGLWVRVVEPGK